MTTETCKGYPHGQPKTFAYQHCPLEECICHRKILEPLMPQFMAHHGPGRSFVEFFNIKDESKS